MRNIAVTLILLLISLGMFGCARHVTVKEWQKSLTQFILDEANGDTSTLREIYADDSRFGYCVFGHTEPQLSTDVSGVLVGILAHNDQTWHIFLVGLVQRQELEEIRMAALIEDRSSLFVIVGEESTTAMTTYSRFNQQLWRQRHPNRTQPPLSYTRFPCESDVFELQTSGSLIFVIEKQSGARWALDTAQHTDHLVRTKGSQPFATATAE